MKLKSNFLKWCLCLVLLAVSLICFSVTMQSFAKESIKPSELITAGFGVDAISESFTIGEQQGSVDVTGLRIKTKNTSANFSYKYEINADLLNKDVSLFELQFLGAGLESYAEAKRAYIYLTDADNPENKIGVVFHPADDLGASNGAVTYFRVSYAGTTLGFDGTRVWEGHYGLCSYNRQMFPGKFDKQAQLFNTYFDYQEKAFYVDTHEGKTMVLDLDNPEHLKGLAPWQGFSSDRCILSMELVYTSSNEGGVVITKILGNDTTGNTIDVTNNAPNVKILAPTNYSTDALPKAEVGRAYKLPDANVFDFAYGSASLDIQAFRGDLDVSSEISDGYITASTSGKIKLVYTVTNSDGKTDVKQAYFTAVNKLPPYVYAKSHSDLPVFGEYYTVPEISVKGGTGNLIVSEVASYNGEELDFSKSRKVLIDQVGYITLSVTVEDYTGRVETTLFSFAISSDKAAIMVNGMPISVQKGTTLTIPEFDLFVDGEKNAKVFVGDVDITNSMQYFVEEEQGTILSVKFCGGTGDKYNEIIYAVRVIDAKYSLFDYFGVVEGDAEIYDSYTDEAVVIETQEDVQVQMAFPVSLQNLYVYFNYDGSFADSFDIILTGFENRTEEMFFRISYESAQTSSVKINGVGKSYSLPISFASFSEYKLKIENQEGALYFSDVKVCDFASFNANGAFLTFRINGVIAQNKVIIKQISNQSFHPRAFIRGDNVAPYIYVDGEINKYKAVYTVGNYFSVPSARAFDVLSNDATVTLRVISPTDKIIFEGTADKVNKVKIDEYGVYVISYVVKDVHGYESRVNYNVELIDRVKPSITVEEKPNDVYSVGDTIEISKVIAKDNVDKNPTIEVFLLNNITFERKIITGKKMRLSEAGSYTLIYKVSDSAMNSVRIEYTITVRG